MILSFYKQKLSIGVMVMLGGLVVAMIVLIFLTLNYNLIGCSPIMELLQQKSNKMVTS